MREITKAVDPKYWLTNTIEIDAEDAEDICRALIPNWDKKNSRKTKLLDDLSVDEVQILLETTNFGMFKDAMKELLVDGKMLNEVTSVDDMKDIGINNGLKARVFFKSILEYKDSGVPLQKITIVTKTTTPAFSSNNQLGSIQTINVDEKVDKAVPIRISGATGPNAHLVNGCYVPCPVEIRNGFPTYQQMEDPDMWLCYQSSSKIWSVKKFQDKDKTSSFGYVSSDPATYPHLCADAVWNIWDSKNWQKQSSVKVTCKFIYSSPIEISNCTGNSYEEILNGVFLPEKNLHGNFSIYKHKDCDTCLLYDDEVKQWQFKTRIRSSGEQIVFCYASCPVPMLPQDLNPNAWHVTTKNFGGGLTANWVPIGPFTMKVISDVLDVSRSVSITKCTGVKAEIMNGIFHPTTETSANYPIYQKSSNPDVWLVRSDVKNWNIKKTEHKSTTLAEAYCNNSPPTLPELHHKSEKYWHCYENGKWVQHEDIRCLTYIELKPVIISGATGLNAELINGHYLPNGGLRSYISTITKDLFIHYNEKQKQWNITRNPDHTANDDTPLAFVSCIVCKSLEEISHPWISTDPSHMPLPRVTVTVTTFSNVAKAVQITGATGKNKDLINRVFYVTDEVNEGSAVYRSREADKDVVLVCSKANNGARTWAIRTYTDRNTNNSFCYGSDLYHCTPNFVTKWWIWTGAKWDAQANVDCSIIYG